MEKKYGIEHTKKLLEQVEYVALGCLSLTKSGIGLSSIRNLVGMFENIKPLVIEAKHSFPELGDLDKEELAELSAVCIKIVKNLVFAAVE